MKISEKNLTIVGCVSFEDQLQDNIKSVIQTFKSIGIKMFILTGD